MPASRPMPTPALAVDHLSVDLGGSRILDDVSVAVRPGEVVAIMGSNGSGKSTLIKAALGLVPIESGTVRLFGDDLRGFRHWVRVGYVPQRSAVPMRGATVREVVAAGRLAHRTPFLPATRDDRRAVTAALDAVGLAERA